jgi:hypothetical protein
VKMETVISCLRNVSSGVLLSNRLCTFEFQKMREFLDQLSDYHILNVHPEGMLVQSILPH